jgi:hypothetical protein
MKGRLLDERAVAEPRHSSDRIWATLQSSPFDKLRAGSAGLVLQSILSDPPRSLRETKENTRCRVQHRIPGFQEPTVPLVDTLPS